MTTFIWIVLAYSLTVFACEAILVWSFTTWMRKMKRAQDIVNNPFINWRYAVFLIALIPAINIYVAVTLLMSYYHHRKVEKKGREIAEKLREIGSRNPEAKERLEEVAKFFDNLPDNA